MRMFHLCFADDLLMFTGGDLASVQQLLNTFQKFTEASGLRANQQKSCIYFGGVVEHVKEEILRLSGMTQGQLPFKYLGVPLAAQKLSVMQCRPMIQKILERVDCWAAKLLSYAGRVQLIRSVLYGIQNYWSQIFLLPQKVIKIIQAACRTFLWTGKSAVSKRALVAWDRICLPKHAGGLGLVNLKLWNKAAICKLLWNIAQKKDKIWVRWVHGFYVKERDLMELPIPRQSAWVVRKILGAREYIRDLQDGDAWLSNSTFSIQKLYRAMSGEIHEVEWSKLICHNPTPPKCIFISWLLLQNSMATCERLTRMGIEVEKTCCV